MYQSVDTTDAQTSHDNQAAAKQAYRKPIIIGTLCAASAICFALIYAQSTNPPPKAEDITASQASHNAYLSAIGESNAALRRARLQDFLRIYPTDERSSAAQAQLEVLTAYETRDWNHITKIAYENSLSHTLRLSALEDYNQRWGGDLLGGRADDIQALRANILELPDVIPKTDRNLDASQSPIPETIISDRLLGEPRRRAVTLPSPPPVRQRPVVKAPVKEVIVKPKVRRNVTPRYPRKALRRNVNALVVLSLSIDAKGKVQMTELIDVQARRYEKDFIKAAERAALRTRYHPQTINGKAVPVSGIIKKYRFRG